MVDKSLSIIIPAYNEEGVILSTVNKITTQIEDNLENWNYEIIVINDGSTDQTAKLAKSINNDNIEVISFLKNRGKGFAVKKGFLKARGNICLYTDADNSTSIDHLFEFINYLDNYDIVIGSRALSKSKITKRQPFYRIILGKAGNFLIRKILKLNYSDTQCGFKLFTKKAVKNIFPEIICNGWSFDFEVLKVAKEKNFKVKELPVVWENNSNSKVKLIDYFKILRDLFIVWKKH